MSELAVVFVQLGNKIPKILTRNFHWVHSEFASVSIHLITDQKGRNNVPKFVNTFTLPETSKVYDLRKAAFSTQFRNGYWLHVSRRILALKDWHLANPGMTLLHVESDMLLMPNFPFEALSKSKTLCWPKVSKTADMPGLLFSPSVEKTNQLFESLFRLLSAEPSLTDMTGLNRLVQLNLVSHSYLPTWLPSEANLDQSLRSSINGIFDAAAIGMWLCGQDPRNHWGIIRKCWPLDSSYLVRPEALQYKYDNGCLKVKSHSSGWVNLFTLHIHSKAPSFFGSRSRFSALYRHVSMAGRQRVSFSIWGFHGALLQLISAGKNRLLRTIQSLQRKIR